MKKIFNTLSVSLLLLLFLSSCSEKESMYIATVPAESDFNIDPSSTNIELNKKGAGTHTAIVFKWDTVVYGVSTPVVFTLQMDSVNGDFSAPIVDIIPTSTYQIAFTDSVMNVRAMKLNLIPDIPGEIKVRLKANLAYNNLPVFSKVEIITVKPYNDGLMYRMPAALYLQGDAVASNGSYPIPDAQQMVKIDNHRFALIISLTGSKHFVFTSSADALSDPAYKAASSSEPITGGAFLPSGSQTDPPNGGSDISSPATTGIYKVIVDFKSGTYTVTKEPALIAAPANLYMVGDATALGWAAPNATQKFTQVDAYTFKITMPIIGGKKYDFITTETTWSDPAYKGATNKEPPMGGNFIESGAKTVPAWAGSDIIAPTASGTYTITVNFKSGTFVLTQ
jgi:starch-binding outer membrane protein SusE/F